MGTTDELPLHRPSATWAPIATMSCTQLAPSFGKIRRGRRAGRSRLSTFSSMGRRIHGLRLFVAYVSRPDRLLVLGDRHTLLLFLRRPARREVPTRRVGCGCIVDHRLLFPSSSACCRALAIACPISNQVATGMSSFLGN